MRWTDNPDLLKWAEIRAGGCPAEVIIQHCPRGCPKPRFSRAFMASKSEPKLGARTQRLCIRLGPESGPENVLKELAGAGMGCFKSPFGLERREQ